MLFDMPEGMTDETAALVEPASVAYHGIGLLDPGNIEKVMVIGVGIIGLLSIKILKGHYNIKEITAVDISEEKLRYASNNGADNTICLKGKDWKSFEQLNDNPFLSGEYEGIIDYVSTSSSMGISIANLKKSGTLVATGLPPEDVIIEKLAYFAIANKELSIKGCYCYTKKDFGDVIEMLSKGKVKVEDLVSAKYDLKEIQSAFKDWEANYSKWYKVLIKP
jgi:L-iditol 2-dehydrogenase